jgi:sugar/nucleoside kinase (ribokinase family)
MTTVVGVGVVAWDYVAVVDKYPIEDTKMRSRSHLVGGGGNCGNALCALHRLSGNINCRIISKVGKDSIGDQIIQDLQSYDIDTTFLVQASNINSPFSYIIANPSNKSRTIIHTPIPEYLTANEVHLECLEGVGLIFLDGRHVEGALELMRHKRDIKVYLECERLKEDSEQLIPYANYVLTSANFPKEYHEMHKLDGDIMETLFHLYERMNVNHDSFVITTLGEKGSIGISQSTHETTDDLTLCQIIERHSTCEKADSYPRLHQYHIKHQGKTYHVFYSEIWTSPPFQIVDTTGAGDTYNGACLYWLSTQSHDQIGAMMQFASMMAAYCASALGTRRGVPGPEIVNDILSNLLRNET